jgi:hypothetical protein
VSYRRGCRRAPEASSHHPARHAQNPASRRDARHPPAGQPRRRRSSQ